MAMYSPPSLDSSSSSSYSIKDDKESPKSRSSSFSISAILSDDIGSQKRSTLFHITTPTNNGGSMKKDGMQLETPKRPREIDTPRNNPLRRPPQITLTEAANLVATPKENTTAQAHPSHPVAFIGEGTPPLHPSRHLNSSLTGSPFDPSFLHTLGQQVSPTEKEDLLSDSLGMLSTVAMYHSELSSTINTPIQNKMADIRITSSYDGSDSSREHDWAGPTTKSRTPSILKRRPRKTSVQGGSDSCTSGDEAREGSNNAFLNTGFLSPLADEKSHQQSGFSPSIFLSRPAPVDMSQRCETLKSSPGQLSDTDSNQDDAFTTSTPIKLDKENAVQRSEGRRPTGWSPSILKRSRRYLLKETNESSCSSSCSESELPVKRPHSSGSLSPPRKRRKKSKARTKLSPLLENACSPIPKADHIPSPLTQAHSTTPTRSHPPHSSTPSVETLLGVSRAPIAEHSSRNIPLSNVTTPTTGLGSLLSNQRPGNPFLNPASLNLGLSLTQPQPTCVIPQLPTQSLTYSVNPLFPPVFAPTPLQPPVLSPTHQYPPHPLLSPPLALPPQSNPYIPLYLQHTNSYGRGGGFVLMPSLPIRNTQSLFAPNCSFVSNVQESSVNSSYNMSGSPFVRRDEKLKSVPPRFIFSNMNIEGKRSRLTEAINKSLSETPSESTKLPKEWTKYACGQTNDQKDLTEKARSFILQCKPRTLNFEEEAS